MSLLISQIGGAPPATFNASWSLSTFVSGCMRMSVAFLVGLWVIRA